MTQINDREILHAISNVAAIINAYCFYKNSHLCHKFSQGCNVDCLFMGVGDIHYVMKSISYFL